MRKSLVIALAIAALCSCAKQVAIDPQTAHNDSILALVPTEETMPVDTVWSTDSLICIYGWDNQTGGQMINWSAVYTVMDSGVCYAYEGLPDWEDDDMSLVIGIHNLPHPTRNLYLFDIYFREWSAVGYLGFITYERIGHALQRVDLIRDKDGMLVEQVGFEYDALDLWPEIIYRWDEPSATIVTEGFGSYHWNGEIVEVLPAN